MMGASNPHPHCQIWATEHIPDEPSANSAAQQAYHEEHHSCLLCDYIATELAHPDARIVVENDLFVALVPYWATWPFEDLVLPRRHLGSFTDLAARRAHRPRRDPQGSDLGYDNLFNVSFPYKHHGLPPAPHAQPHLAIQTTTTCTSTPTSTHLSSVLPRFESSWSASKCSAPLSAT